ncbi:MAG: hypothetical protein ACK5PB_09505 [Pirellula sp.]|jgi:hypothetical protein
MRSETVQISPYVVLFLILSVSVLGTAWVAAQFKKSSNSLDYAQAVPGQIKFVSGSDAKRNQSASSRHETVTIVKKLNNVNPGLATNHESYWYRYHAHLLPIAVGFFMLTLSGWSLIGVENLAIQALNP